jgi:hypothetical protein
MGNLRIGRREEIRTTENTDEHGDKRREELEPQMNAD